MGMKKILVPVDGSESSGRALGQAIALAAALQAKLSFLYVANVHQLAVNSCLSAELLEAVNKAGDVVLSNAEARVPDGMASERLLETGSPASAIVDAAEASGADLIVMGSRGLGLVKGVLLGSVSRYVVENARCAVMVVK